jgi:hypothetical protein
MLVLPPIHDLIPIDNRTARLEQHPSRYATKLGAAKSYSEDMSRSQEHLSGSRLPNAANSRRFGLRRPLPLKRAGVARQRTLCGIAILLLSTLLPAANAQSQLDAAPNPSPKAHAGQDSEAPLPDIPALMHDVEANQRKAEAIEKNYAYHSVETEQEVDGHGRAKKTTVTESDHYWINGVPIRRIVKKDGKDLSPDELAKENERVEKQAAKARERRDKGDAEGKETDPDGRDVITVSRLLALGAFANPRRIELNGRPTIEVDYVGDPKAKTRNRAEEAIRDMTGTAWVDEQDHVLARAEGHFVSDYKVGGGLIVDVKKDTRFAAEWSKINSEVWLPARLEGQGALRALLLIRFSGSIHVDESGYRKFKATSTVLPGMVEHPEEQPQIPDKPQP